MTAYVIYLFKFDRASWTKKVIGLSYFKLLLMIVWGFFIVWFFYVGWGVSPDRPLNVKIKSLLGSDFGLIFLFPAAWMFISILFFVVLMLVWIFLLKISNQLERRNE